MNKIDKVIQLADYFYALAADENDALTNRERQRLWRERHPEKEHQKSVEQAARIRQEKDKMSLDGLVTRFQQQLAELKSEAKRAILKSIPKQINQPPPNDQDLRNFIDNHPRMMNVVRVLPTLYDFKDKLRSLVVLQRADDIEETKPLVTELIGRGSELISQYSGEFKTITNQIKLIVSYLQDNWIANSPRLPFDVSDNNYVSETSGKKSKAPQKELDEIGKPDRPLAKGETYADWFLDRLLEKIKIEGLED